MIKPISVILLASSLLTNQRDTVVQAVDWLNDVPAAVGLVGCTRDGPDNGPTQWHCPEQRHPLPSQPNPPLLQWRQTAPFIGENRRPAYDR